ncbi:MAG TPA: hypothetical protein VIJ85_13640 [Rhizomicrobium sp.]
MLAMMAAATQALLLTSARIDNRALERIEAHAALDAALTRAVLGISDARLDQRWRVDGATTKFEFDGVKVGVKIQDQLGLIDLNAADGSIIDQLLQSVGMPSDDAASMTDRILDWRSDTALKRLHGASDADYIAAGYSYHQRHGPFQSVAELRLVLGMTPQLFAKIEPALTVYSGRPALDPNLAPEQALRALYLNAPDQVNAILRARNGTPGNDAQNGAFSGTLSPMTSIAGQTFSVGAALELGGRQYAQTAVVEFTGDDDRPYMVLAWQ